MSQLQPSVSGPRELSAIDLIAEDFLEAKISLSPILATYLGVAGYEDRFDDFSINGVDRELDLTRQTLRSLEVASQDVTSLDSIDTVTAAALREELTVSERALERVIAGIDPTPLNVIDCPVQSVRDAFDLMATTTAQHWEWVLSRLQAVPKALADYTGALRYSAERGSVAPRRQVSSVLTQCQAQAQASSSTYTSLLADAGTIPPHLVGPLHAAVRQANAAFGVLAEFLAGDLLSQAPDSDAAGPERYRLRLRAFLGTEVDLEETYRWGQDEVARIAAMMHEVAEQIEPGASIERAIAVLDDDPQYQLESTAALKAWMQDTADEAISAMADTHFDIPEPIRTIECMIAPSQTGIIYYTGPSEDFTRPGRMWWSVPAGVSTFTTWRELTTVYHEGVPGHHLQIAQTTLRQDTLNRWRRLACWSSGNGEGWALYAEWLMSDLGYLDDPGMRMGLLDAQSLRAARVVIDIGVHCELEAPAEVGGGTWTYDKAWTYLNNHVRMEQDIVRFELDRYLGYPGQAPSYKIGERRWLELRDEVRRREGDSFDLAAFHRRALNLGGVGLDVLREAMLSQA